MSLMWEKLKEVPAQLGYRKILEKTFKLPDGSIKDFTIKHERRAVCIFALTTSNKVIIAKQFRPGPEKVLMEMPGGAVEAGEDPMECAARELLEETGYAGDFEFIGTTLDCAYSTMVRYNYVARNCVLQGPQNLDDSEFINVELISIPDFLKLLRSGEMSDVESGYLALDKLGILQFSDTF